MGTLVFKVISFRSFKEKNMSTEEMLKEAINLWGMEDIVTIMLSQRLDKEVVEKQQKLLKSYREVV